MSLFDLIVPEEPITESKDEKKEEQKDEEKKEEKKEEEQPKPEPKPEPAPVPKPKPTPLPVHITETFPQQVQVTTSAKITPLTCILIGIIILEAIIIFVVIKFNIGQPPAISVERPRYANIRT